MTEKSIDVFLSEDGKSVGGVCARFMKRYNLGKEPGQGSRPQREAFRDLFNLLQGHQRIFIDLQRDKKGNYFADVYMRD